MNQEPGACGEQPFQFDLATTLTANTGDYYHVAEKKKPDPTRLALAANPHCRDCALQGGAGDGAQLYIENGQRYANEDGQSRIVRVCNPQVTLPTGGSAICKIQPNITEVTIKLSR